MLRKYWDEEKIEFIEQFKVLLLNRDHKVIGLYEVSTGTTTHTVADLRLIFVAAIKANACAIVLSHNYPSGNLNPSQADMDLTKKVKEAGKFLEVSVLDHIIITSESYYSFADEGVEKESIDLVLMGSHGASGIREFFLGSNAEKMVRTSPVPVLVMKDYFKGSIKNIVFPNTLETEDQEDLVMKVKALQNFFKAHLHLVWINTPLNFTGDSETNERLQAFAKRFMLRDYTISVFNHTDEEGGILEFTTAIKGDLIAMGTHGRRGISHLINGSLAEDVVNHNRGLVWTYSLKNVSVEA